MEDQQPTKSETLFPHETGHRRSARERQRRGPMWGCLKAVSYLAAGALLLLFIGIFAGWWYVGTSSFAEKVRLRIESTLEARLGREVTIKSVEIVRDRPRKIILNDLRIANAPGGVSPHFATVQQVIITGGVDSFLQRRIKVGRVEIIGSRMNFEVYPDGGPLVHNFPKWNSGPPRKNEIVRMDIGQLFVTNGSFLFLDRRHKISAESTGITSEVNVTLREGIYQGSMSSPRLRVKLQDYEPFDLDMRGAFRYAPGALALNSIALRGRGIDAFISGRVQPLTEGVYDLKLTSKLDLQRVREIFRVEKLLEGVISLDTNLKGRQGDYQLTGGWISPGINADAYELTGAKGRLDVNGQRAIIDVQSAGYGGGTIGAHYTLSNYSEPYPMNVDLRYDGISIEKLFSDWGVEDTGLRAAATGSLAYRWEKDRVLDGSGTGSARLARNAVAFSKAKYPIAIAGSTDFALNRGIVTFRRLELDTTASHVSLTGTLGIEDVITDFRMNIRSSDFSELDRLAYNFARSAGKKDFELLGLGGSGTIAGTVRGPLKTPDVTARISGTGTKYNNVVLGASTIDLRYEGRKSLLTFDRAVFSDGEGRLALNGTLAFPDRGPSPLFDIAVEATNYPVDRAIQAVKLDLRISGGRGTGKLIVSGTPESGKVTFAALTIRRADSELELSGDVNWRPGGGNVTFDLGIDARDFPVKDIITFLDLGELPVTGDVTGKLHISGPKDRLEGSGQVTIARGSIYGEPIDVASADILFTGGLLRARNLSVTSPAGQITGEAEMNLATDKFSYTIKSSSVDLSRLELLKPFRELLGGRITISSTGAGTLEQPELVVELTLHDATLRGLALPPGAAAPSFYLAIRNGRLIIRGSVADIVSIEGEGSVGENLAVDGTVKVVVTDIARLLLLTPQTTGLPASGRLAVDMKLGGKLSPIEALRVDATVPDLDLRVSDHQFTAPQPLRIGLRDGRIVFDSFELAHDTSSFAVTGYAEITGDKRIAINAQGGIEAALLQLFLTDVRADGHVSVAAAVGGTMAAPVVTGTAELQSAQVRFAGFPQLIDNINGTLRFQGDSVQIESVRATVGGGTVVAGGAVALAGLKPISASVTLEGTGVALRYFEGVTIEGNFVLQISGDAERAAVQGEVDVSRALYFRDFDLQQAIVNALVTRSRITPIVAANWQQRVDLRIHLNAEDTLAVRNNVAEVTGSADLDVTGTLAEPVILGTVDLDEGGTVTFQSVDYRLVRGTINFQNPFRIDPYFDVTLEGRVSGGISEVEAGPIDLTVNLTGTLDRMQPSITSDPPASDITLFSLLGFGALTRNGSADQSASVVGQSLLYSSLFSALGQRILPFADSFTYDPGLLDTGSGATPKVSFEKRVSNDVRLIVVYDLDSHKSREVIEWQATREWTLQITRDETERDFRVEGRFRRRYRGHWTWGRRGRGEELFDIGSISEAISLDAPPPTTRVLAIPGSTVVSQVNFRADGRFDTSILAQYVTVKSGEPLQRREIQSSVKALFSTGNFRDIRVDVAGGGVVTFALSLNYRISRITFEGVEGSDRRRSERELTMRVGEVLSLNEVEDSSIAIQQKLSQFGFLEATVDPETNFERETNRADVKFLVTLGPLAKISTVAIDGELQPFTQQELIKEMRQKPGKAFNIGDARSDADRIKTHVVRKKFRRADVEFKEHKYDEKTKTVSLRYAAVIGPVVEVVVEGVDRDMVRRYLPFRARNQEYSEDVIEQATENITRSMQERGYFNVTVDPESRLEGEKWITVFKIVPGQRFTLAGVSFNGNIKVRDRELERLVETTPRGGFRRIISSLLRRRTGVTREQLSSDREAVESYYLLQGFSEAAVATPVVQTRADGTMTVEFPVTEGPQTMVTAVNVEGLERTGARDLPNLRLEVGDPLNPQLLRDDIIALQTFYADSGYAEVQIATKQKISDDKTSAVITYQVSEGPQVQVDEVIVRGNTYTSSEVILRTSELSKGDPFNYTSILEAQRNLYRLGVFNRVDITPDRAGTTVSDRNVVISVEEGRNLTVTGSAGVSFGRDTGDRVSPRLAAALAHRNLFGTGRYLGFEGVYGPNEEEAFLTYREPFIGRYAIPVLVTLFQTYDGTVTERRVQQRGASIEASKVSRYRSRWSLQYQYKISECLSGLVCERADEIFVPGLDRSLLDIQISSITPTFFWDKRDDVIDPHRGFFTSASVEYAFPLFAAKTKFFKEFVQGAWYIPVSTRSVIALSARAGLIQPQGSDDPTTPDVDETLFVPVAERFTAGGDTSNRAYPLDLLGTLCADLVAKNAFVPLPGAEDCEATLIDLDPRPGQFRLAPLGGNGNFIFNAEYRFPIVSSLGGAVFVDAGNVFAASKINFGDLRYGVGAGVRYISPVGPLRIDIGYPLSRRVYDKSISYSVTLGYAF